MVDGHAALSPIRFHYDSEDFTLPIRLGMANSSGKQDLIVNIISADKRYEVANYKNVFIPTNFDVKPTVKTRFGEFYAALFDKTVEANPGAVVTEYAWTATRDYHCDPCTDADVSDPDLMTLGGDIVGGEHRERLRADAAARALRQDRHEGRPAVPRGQAGHRRPRAVDARTASSTARRRRSRTSSRRATRSATGGPARSRARTRSAACGAGRPTAATSSTIAASKIAFAPRGKLAARHRDRPRPVGDRLQEGRGAGTGDPGRWRNVRDAADAEGCIGAARPRWARSLLLGVGIALRTKRSDAPRARCDGRRAACGSQEPQVDDASTRIGDRARSRRACRARPASSRRAWSRSIARRAPPGDVSDGNDARRRR